MGARSETKTYVIDGHRWTFTPLPGSLAFDYRPLILGLAGAAGEGFAQSGDVGGIRAIFDRLPASTMALLRSLLFERGSVEIDGKKLNIQTALDGDMVSLDEALEALVQAVLLSFGPFSGLVARFRKVLADLSPASKTSPTDGQS